MTAALNTMASRILEVIGLCPIARSGSISRDPMYYPIIHSLQQLFISRWLCEDAPHVCDAYVASPENVECMWRVHIIE